MRKHNILRATEEIRNNAHRLLAILLSLSVLATVIAPSGVFAFNEGDGSQDAASDPAPVPAADAAATADTDDNADQDNGVLEVSSPVGSYTVDFYFTAEDGTETEYHLKGGSEIMLSELFAKLGIDRDTADIKKTVFTDNELVKFVKEGDDYRVISLKPFDTEESLTITFEDDEVAVLRVTDATPGNRTPEGNVNWNLDANGTLTIRIANSASSGGFTTNRTKQAEWNGFWATSPGGSTYIRTEVTKVIIKKNDSGVPININNIAIAYMFSGFTNLESVEIQEGALSGSPTNIASMFRDCKKLKSITGLEHLDTTNVQDMSSTFNGVGSATTGLTLDLSAWKNNERVYNLQNMFANSGITEVTLNNVNFKTRPYASGGCQMGAMFFNSKIKKIDMSNITLTGRPSDTTAKTGHNAEQEAGGILSTGRNGNATLETVIMNDTKFEDMAAFDGMFSKCPNLTTIQMTKTRAEGDTNSSMAPDAVDMRNMFANSFTSPAGTGTPTIDVSGFGKLDKIVNMGGFVDGCTGLKIMDISTMDNSRIKPVNSHHSAQDDPAETTGAKVLNVDWDRNLKLDTCTSLEWLIADGSKVWMTTNVKGNSDDQYYNSAVESDGKFYYFTEKQMDLYKEKPADLTTPGDANEKIASRRDYVDVMTDRYKDNKKGNGPDYATNVNTEHGQGHINTNGAGFLAPLTYHLLGSEWDKVKAPYQKTFYYIDETLLAASTPAVSIARTDLVRRSQGSETTISTSGKTHTEWVAEPVIKMDDDSPVITLTYPNAAKDVNGNSHDVVVKINKVTFTNLGSIHDRPTGRIHDGNRYKSDCSKYYRDILTYGTGILQLKNYARASDGTVGGENIANKTIIKGDAGADIDFSIEIKDALPNTSVLFYIDDLDIPAWQGYEYPSNDACYDNLPWDYTAADAQSDPPKAATGIFYDGYSEGIVLREGNDIETLKYPTIQQGDDETVHTGLKVDKKTVNSNQYTYIHGTGSDPSSKTDTNRGPTGWSGFSVKGDATRSNYTWTNGIGCTTDILNPTRGTTFDPVKIKPDAFKSVNNGIPSGDYEEGFTFQIIKAKEVSKVTFEIDGFPVKETSSGQMYFKDDNNDYYAVTGYCKSVKLTPGQGGFDPAGTDADVMLDNLVGDDFLVEENNKADLIDFGELSYNHPGADGAHAYIYRIHEKVESSESDVLKYNTDHVTYFMKVIVTNPSSDIEMEKGIKAEVTIGRHYNRCTEEEWKTKWDDEIDPNEIVWDDWSQVVWSLDADEKGKRWQENLEIYYPQRGESGATLYPVKRDKNKVEYIAVPASKVPHAGTTTGTVYLDANNPYIPLDPTSHTSPSVLVVTEEGDVYPYSEQTDADWLAEHHPDKELSKPLIVDGKDVREDVHGQMYIKDGSDYYAVVPNGDIYEKGSKLIVKDGIFNPDSNYDKQVHVSWKVNGAQVMVDFDGQKYYKADTNDYRDPGDDPEAPTTRQLRLGKAGKVLPKATDKNVTHDKTGGAILIVNDNEDQPQKVHITDKGALYYKKGDGYYSVMHTMLTPGIDDFDPKTTDKPYETDFDIMEDGDGTYYYRSDGAYYIYAPEDPTKNGQPYTPSSPGNVDHTVIDIGYFKNKVKESSIIIKKKAVDSAGTEVSDDRSGVFDYIIEFKNNAGEPTDFTPTDYQFSPAAPTEFEKLDTGKFKFRLTEDQQVQIYGVPFNITYTVSEPISDEMNLNGWEFVQLDGTEQYDPANPNKKEPETLKVRSVTRKVLTEDVSYHTHTFTNRFTEAIVDKKVIDAPTSEKDKEFSFKAKVDVDLGAERGGQSFSYGTMQQAESDDFKMETTDADGKASVEIEFTLKADEDIALVVPQGSKVVVTEKAEKNYITKVSGEYPTKAEAKASKIELAADECKNMPQPKLHFKNIYIPPVEKQLGVEKILKGRAWRDSDKFDMAILPLDNAPLPDHATVKDDLVYLEAVVSNDDEPVMDQHDPTKLEGYKAFFEKNAWHIGDFRKDDGTFETEKTFKYNVRELTAAESGLPRISGVTYSSEEYRIEVTVEVKNADTDKPSLEIKSFKVYKMNGTGSSATLGEAVDIPVFTNVYDAHETTYKFEAVKDYADSHGNTVDYVTGEYKFVIKPFGRYKTIAPMPMGKDVNGKTPGQTGENREFVATNESDGDIEFRDATYTPMNDGFRFNYDEIIEHLIEHRMAEKSIDYATAAAEIDAELHSDTGIDFEYEIYEVIPDAKAGETKVNNDDGTWSIINDATGEEKIYDGIHHTRMITVRVEDKPAQRAKDGIEDKTIDVGGVTCDVYIDAVEVEFYTKDSITYKAEDNSPYTPIVNILVVEGHGDDHKQDFYFDKNGNEKVAEDNIENYDEIHHVRTGDGHEHYDNGAPIFLNYHFEQDKADLVIKKDWDDQNDRDKIRPEYVTVNIKSDRGIRLDKDVKVEGSSWEIIEKDLPVWRFDREAYYAALKLTDLDERKEAMKNCRAKINYTVTEKKDSSITGDEKKAYKTEDYNVSTDPTKKNPNPVKVTLDPDAIEELTITVTNKHVPAPGKIIGDETYGLKGEKQKGKPNYKGNPNDPVTPKKLVKPEKPGATISDDGKTVTIPGEGSYELNDDGTITFTPEKDFVGDPTPIDVEGEDETGNTLKGTYKPHVVDPEDSVTVKRVIQFTYEKKNGKKVTDSITQTGTITRKALEIDPKTGKVTKWGPWTSYTFPAVKNPDEEAGPEWATQDIAGELTVNGPQDDIPVEYIVYHKTTDEDPDRRVIPTGDDSRMLMWFVIMITAGILLFKLRRGYASKIYSGKHLRDDA